MGNRRQALQSESSQIGGESVPILSVIVPVYNVENYLRQSLDSLIAQTRRDIEFIVVNDGSPDHSWEIIREYAARDSRFRYIEQENRGFSGSRNRGLDEARGKYIGFVDSDDWIEPDMYDKLLNLAESTGADIAQGSYFHCYVKEGIVIPHDNSPYVSLLAASGGKLRGAEGILFEDGTIWNRIYRRKMLEENQIRFSPEMTFGEDAFFHRCAVCCAEKIAAIPDPLYHYRRHRPGSATNSSDRRMFSCIISVDQFEKFAMERGLDYLQPWINHLKISFPCFGYGRIRSDYRGEYFDRFREYLQKSGLDEHAPIAQGAVGGGLPHRMRYRILKYLHPATVRALHRNDRKAFDRIIALREYLAQMPLRLQRWKKTFQPTQRDGRKKTPFGLRKAGSRQIDSSNSQSLRTHRIR